MTDITISSITSRISSLSKLVSGVHDSIDPPPPAIVSANLPLSIVFTGESSSDDGNEYGDDLTLISRVFLLQIFALSIMSGTPSNRESVVRPIIDAARSLFDGYPTLDDLPFVVRSKVLGDSGPAILPEYGGKFIGTEIRLQVTYLVPRIYLHGE